MKKIFPFILILLVFGCHKQGSDQNLVPSDLALNYGAKFDNLLLGIESSNTHLILERELSIENQGVTLPAKTVLQKVDGDPNTLTYALPAGYKVVGTSANGKARAAAGGSVTCNCTQGTGCSPYVATFMKNQSIGCAASGKCSKCNLTVTGGSPRIGASDDTLNNIEIVNFNQETHFITTKEELSRTVSPSKTLMELDEVRQQIVYFAKAYQIDDLEALNKSTGIENVPSTYTYIHVNIYGRAILLPVQNNLVNAANPLFNEIIRDATSPNGRIAATVYKCKCNTAGSGCSLNNGSLLLAKAYWCEAGSCNSCTLSWL